MAQHDIVLMKENASSDFEIKTVTAVANKVLGFDANVNPVMVDAGGGSSTVSFTTGLTSLTIDLAGKEYCLITLSASDTFVLSNITTGKPYTFSIKNTSGNIINVNLPSGQIYQSNLVAMNSTMTREFSMIFDGTKQRWHYSEQLLNG